MIDGSAGCARTSNSGSGRALCRPLRALSGRLQGSTALASSRSAGAAACFARAARRFARARRCSVDTSWRSGDAARYVDGATRRSAGASGWCDRAGRRMARTAGRWGPAPPRSVESVGLLRRSGVLLRRSAATLRGSKATLRRSGHAFERSEALMKARTAVLAVMTAFLANMNAVLAIAGPLPSSRRSPFARRAAGLTERPGKLADGAPLLTVTLRVLRRRIPLVAAVTTPLALRTPFLVSAECLPRGLARVAGRVGGPPGDRA